MCPHVTFCVPYSISFVLVLFAIDLRDLNRFISDGMGHPTLIADNTFSTKLPADVDEEKFSPSSTSLPLTGPSDEECENSSAYMVLKCRYVQLGQLLLPFSCSCRFVCVSCVHRSYPTQVGPADEERQEADVKRISHRR